MGTQHPLGAAICSSEKCVFGGNNSTSRSPRSLDRTSPDLFWLTREKLLSIKKLLNFKYLYPFQRFSPPNFEVDRNRAKFCIKLSLVLTIMQNFTPVCRRISEISRGKKLKIWGKAQSKFAFALSLTGGKLKRGRISLALKSRAPNSNALAYAKRALST